MQLDADRYEEEGKLAAIREEREYSYSDLCTISRDKLPLWYFCPNAETDYSQHNTQCYQVIQALLAV